MENLDKLIGVATGEQPADLVLKGGRVFNVFNGEFAAADIAIVDGKIAGIGSYKGISEIDVSGKYLTPGFIDAHIHIESTLLSPQEFARAALPNGTTAVIADPHEIANVCGTDGIRYMLAATEKLPLTVYMMLPSCVPASSLENSGACLGAAKLAEFMDEPRVLGLGEMMNYPGVLNCESDVLAKLELAAGRLVDGHSPGLSGRALQAYAAAGISSEHECTTVAEARERLAAGMALLIREGSAAKNLAMLLPAINGYNARFCMFAADDRNAADLLREGHINHIVRQAVHQGLSLKLALTMATLNPAQHYRLAGKGALAPRYDADILVFDNLTDFKPQLVFTKGCLTARDGKAVFDSVPDDNRLVINRMKLAAVDKTKLRLPATGKKARVIGLVPQQIVTRELIREPRQEQGEFVADPSGDILKLAVFERHHATGNISAALLEGFGLKRGALASTIAHDSHNLIAVGASDDDIIMAAEELRRMGGGIVAVDNGRVLAKLELPLGGLMSDKGAAEVASKMAEMIKTAHELGVRDCYSPFLTLSFLSLPVIPELKLTDLGLVDGRTFELVTTAVE